MFEIMLPYGGINRIRFIGYDLRGNGNHFLTPANCPQI